MGFIEFKSTNDELSTNDSLFFDLLIKDTIPSYSTCVNGSSPFCSKNDEMILFGDSNEPGTDTVVFIMLPLALRIELLAVLWVVVFLPLLVRFVSVVTTLGSDNVVMAWPLSEVVLLVPEKNRLNFETSPAEPCPDWLFTLVLYDFTTLLLSMSNNNYTVQNFFCQFLICHRFAMVGNLSLHKIAVIASTNVVSGVRKRG